MRRVRKLLQAGALVALMVPTAGCFEGVVAQEGVLGLFVRFVGATPVGKRRNRPYREQVDVNLTGSYGGLSGTYSVSVGDYGTVDGIARIRGQRHARQRLKDLDQEAVDNLATLAEAVVLDRTGVTIDVTRVRANYKGSQTRGGVKKIYRGTISFWGTQVDGPNAGKKVRGRLSARGRFE